MRKLLYVSLLLVPLILRAESSKTPPEKELQALTHDSLLAFNKAIQEKSFAGFYKEQLASVFRKEVSLEKFSAAFKVFLDGDWDRDISNVAKAEAVFDKPPAVNKDGVLVLNGYYPTRPNRVTFQLKYLNESGAWKLVGINVQVVPFVEKTGPVPSEKELKALALDSLLAFNKALQEKNFAGFYEQVAKLWQDQTTPAKLQAIFQPFIDNGADISPVAKMEPVFEQKPAVNANSFLVLKGYYPTQPSRVFFELKYVYEETAWKLVGINLNLKKATDKAEKKAESDDE